MDTPQMMDMTQALLADGWTEYHDQLRRQDHGRSFYKRHDTPTRCRANDDKPGIQVTAHTHRLSAVLEGMPDSYTFELVGELPNGTWHQGKLYSLKVDGIEEGLKQIPILLDAWEAACQSART